jgi:hypothetical protein
MGPPVARQNKAMARSRSRSRSCSRKTMARSRSRSRSHDSARQRSWNKTEGRRCDVRDSVRWVATKNGNHVAIDIDGDGLPKDILQNAKGLANGMLQIEGGIKEAIRWPFPHDLDGGWIGVSPDSEWIVYMEITTGKFAGVCAMGRGSNKDRRERAAAYGLLLAAATTHDLNQPSWSWMADWLEEAARQHRLMMNMMVGRRPGSETLALHGGGGSSSSAAPRSLQALGVEVEALRKDNAQLRLEVTKVQRLLVKVCHSVDYVADSSREM